MIPVERDEWKDLVVARPSWDVFWLNIANAFSLRGTCKRLKVGAILVSQDNNLLSWGYNGSPKGAAHCIDVGCVLEEVDGVKHCAASVHAEANTFSRPHGSLKGATLYTTVTPCYRCAKDFIINSGVTRVVYALNYNTDARALELLTKSGVRVERITPREFLVDGKDVR